MKPRLCRWRCGRKTPNRSGICLECVKQRDDTNKRIDAGLEAYVQPEERPNHRFFKRKQLSAGQKASIAKANAAKQAKSLGQMPHTELSGAVKGNLP